jgi:hypothetical protein
VLRAVHRCFWWVGVLIGVVGVRRVQFLIAKLAGSLDVLRATALLLSSAFGRA